MIKFRARNAFSAKCVEINAAVITKFYNGIAEINLELSEKRKQYYRPSKTFFLQWRRNVRSRENKDKIAYGCHELNCF